MSTYIHLNPARARLAGEERPGLEKYRWSSYPAYLVAKKTRPAWLEVRTVFGSMGLKDDGTGRKRYEEYIAGQMNDLKTQVGKKMYKDTWNLIRHGWCLGGQGFEEKILELAGLRMAGGRTREIREEQPARLLLHPEGVV